MDEKAIREGVEMLDAGEPLAALAKLREGLRSDPAEAKVEAVREYAGKLLAAANQNRVNPGVAATYEDVAGDLLSLVGEVAGR